MRPIGIGVGPQFAIDVAHSVQNQQDDFFLFAVGVCAWGPSLFRATTMFDRGFRKEWKWDR